MIAVMLWDMKVEEKSNQILAVKLIISMIKNNFFQQSQEHVCQMKQLTSKIQLCQLDERNFPLRGFSASEGELGKTFHDDETHVAL